MKCYGCRKQTIVGYLILISRENIDWFEESTEKHTATVLSAQLGVFSVF
jgi:hypothetical protein